jgi:hypothetical protein
MKALDLVGEVRDLAAGDPFRIELAQPWRHSGDERLGRGVCVRGGLAAAVLAPTELPTTCSDGGEVDGHGAEGSFGRWRSARASPGGRREPRGCCNFVSS